MAVVLSFMTLLVVYAVVDRVLRRADFVGGFALAWLTGALLVAAPFWSWELVTEQSLTRWMAWGIACFIAWNAATRDLDPVNPGPGGWLRVLLMASALGSFASPALLLVAAGLLSRRFHFWQHHAAFPMRVLQSLVAFVVLATPLGLCSSEPPGWFSTRDLEAALAVWLTTMLAAHYVITALAKTMLGPKPWSWVLHNRLHFLPASAYSWGWARFVPWRLFRRVVAGVRRIERPLQVVVFVLEFTVPLALLDQRFAVAYAVAFAGFHVGVFLLSGLFFWDWILTDLLLALWVAVLPAAVVERAFDLVPLVVGCLTLAIFPLRHRLYKPMPLGWYDSPFTQRVHWQVTGASGKIYGLYNDFMCPHERLYGKVHGSFAVPYQVLTYHLGELWKLELRDALVDAGPDLERLGAVRRQFGIRPLCEQLTMRHKTYLTAFFAALNRGEKKSLLPRWARWFKAPGDQLFYWGELEPYQRQEAVSEVRMIYREEFYDGRDLVRLIDEELLRFEVAADSQGLAFEMTPRELDDYLLGLASGRLIDLPGFKKEYLAADDQAGKLAHA